jgi:beta-glucosidase
MTFCSFFRRIEPVCLILLCVFLTSCHGNRTASKTNPFAAYDAQAKALLAQMTLDEKIGQMIQAEIVEPNKLSDIETYFIGSLLNGGTRDPIEGNSIQAWTNLYDTTQQHALKTRLGIPLLYGIDAVHGHSNVLNAVIFPHNIGLGCTRNPKLVQEVSRITAIEVRATGINWTFAPCITVPQDERWGRAYEGFAEEPKLVSELGEAAVWGLQGSDLSDPLSLVACIKHYVGDGGTLYGSAKSNDLRFRSWIRLDQGDTRVDEATLRRIHLYPYWASIRAGAATIMPSYSSWNGLKCSANKYLLTDVLKKEMGFEGFLISDYNAIDQITPDYKEATMISINAGMDMVMTPKKYKEFFKALKELVHEGKVPMSRIDDAVTRILRVKFAAGLMDKNRLQLADRSLWDSFGSPEHRQVARQAVRESLVLLKNEKKTLPLSKQAARIHVAGKGADNIGLQCGGWTISHQGSSGEATTGGTTILTAMKNTVSKDTQITYSKDGTGAEGATVGVVVIGEKPYAEGSGDRTDLTLAKEDIEVVQTMKKAGIPVVVVLLSGRPMILNETLGQADAFIAAWLPGTEGQGVADVLFGDYKPVGKLSFSWPRSMKQIPINIGDKDYDPLFKYGYGLSY